MALPKQAKREMAEPPVTDLQEAVRRARGGERVVGGEGDAVAVVVPLADLRRLQEDDRRRAEAVEALFAVARAFEHLDPEETDRGAQAAVDEIRVEWRGIRPAFGS